MKPSYDPKTQLDFSNYGDHSATLPFPLLEVTQSKNIFLFVCCFEINSGNELIS